MASVSSWSVGAGVRAAATLEFTFINVHTGVAINVQLVAGPAGALERSLSVDANVLAGPIKCQTLIHICAVESILVQLVA